MTTEPIDIPITTDYDDQGAKDAIKDAEKLEQLEPTVEFDADTSKVEGATAEITDSAQALMDRNPWIAEFQADTANLKSGLEEAQTKLRETGDKADDAKKHIDKIGDTQGPRLAGNQVADLTGPFGDASGAASNFGGVFDGLADIGEKVATKVGLDAAAMSSAIGGIGFAVAGAAAVWTIFKQKQEEAKKKAEEHLKVQEDLMAALKKGDVEGAAKKWIELYGDIIDKGHKAGLSTDELVDGIANSGNAAATANRKLEDNAKQIDEITRAYNELHTVTQASGAVPSDEENKLLAQLTALKDGTQGLIDYKDQYAELTQKQKDNQAIQDAVQTALGDTATKLDDAAEAAGRAKQKTDDLAKGFDDLRGHLDIKRTMEDFETNVTTAMNNIALGIPPTKEEIRTIEDTIVEVGEYANLNPIEVQSLLNAADNGDMFTVLQKMQGYVTSQGALEVEVQAKINQADLRKQLAGFQSDMNAQFGNKPGGTSAGRAAPTIVNHIHVPGASPSQIARAQRQSGRRNGRRYGTQPTTVRYARR